MAALDDRLYRMYDGIDEIESRGKALRGPPLQGADFLGGDLRHVLLYAGTGIAAENGPGEGKRKVTQVFKGG